MIRDNLKNKEHILLQEEIAKKMNEAGIGSNLEREIFLRTVMLMIK